LTLSMMIFVCGIVPTRQCDIVFRRQCDTVFRRQCDIVFRHDSVILFSDTTVWYFLFLILFQNIFGQTEKYSFYVTFILFDKEQLYSSTLKKIYIESYLFDACRSRSILISLERERVKQLFYIYMYMY
jgi:hypothetical protein